ncbi:hypothetical protein M422DRAFT_776711 [Sphaerobolus stellatus SS14]|nr:hypothetical protein M422DRAFT_776711 [Sphaerobolus stellatus SS14]
MVDVSLNTASFSTSGHELASFNADRQPEDKGMVGEPEAASSTLGRKRGIECCDGTNCGPTHSKRRNAPPDSSAEDILEAGKFQCACSEWVSLKDENGISLKPWTIHIAVCEHAKAKGIGSLEDMLNISDSDMQVELEASSSNVPDQQPSAISAPAPPAPAPHSDGNEITEASKQIQESQATSKHAPSNQQPSNDPISNQDSAGGLLDVSASPEKSVMRESVSVPATSTSTFAATPHARRVRGPNRSEAERIAEFRDDPQVKEFDPYRVLCAICDKWIKLRNNSRYCSIPWKCHKASCSNESKEKGSRRGSKSATKAAVLDEPVASGTDITPVAGVSATPEASMNPAIDIIVPPPNLHPSLLVKDIPTISLPQSRQPSEAKSDNDAEVNPSEASNKASSSSSVIPKEQKQPKEPRRRIREADAAVRRAALEADPYSDLVEPDRILCKLCKKWVKLRPNSSYCSAPWQSHIQRCVAKTERQRPDLKWVSDKGSPFANKKSKDNAPSSSSPIDEQKTDEAQAQEAENVEITEPSIDIQASEQSNAEQSAPRPSSQPEAAPPPETPKKRRGRPPKYLQTQKKQPGSQSDVSIESEEEDDA